MRMVGMRVVLKLRACPRDQSVWNGEEKRDIVQVDRRRDVFWGEGGFTDGMLQLKENML